jgi:hypothetical protein
MKDDISASQVAERLLAQARVKAILQNADEYRQTA